jgi:hypothetical protein
MRTMIRVVGGVLAVVIMSAIQAQGATIVYYDFNTNGGSANVTNNILTAKIALAPSLFTTNGLTGTTPIISYPSGNTPQADKVSLGYVAGNSVSFNNWAAGSSTTKYFQVSVDTTGWQSILLSYDLQRSAGGPKTNSIWVSTDAGVTFNSYNETFLSVASAYVTFTNNLSALVGTSVENNPNVVIKWYPYLSNAGGTLRIDNLTIDATAIVPEPSTVVLVGAGLVGLLALRRRRS